MKLGSKPDLFKCEGNTTRWTIHPPLSNPPSLLPASASCFLVWLPRSVPCGFNAICQCSGDSSSPHLRVYVGSKRDVRIRWGKLVIKLSRFVAAPLLRLLPYFTCSKKRSCKHCLGWIWEEMWAPFTLPLPCSDMLSSSLCPPRLCRTPLDLWSPETSHPGDLRRSSYRHIRTHFRPCS